MTYGRFFAMIATSTLVMFVLMYLNTYAWEHVFFSETRTYMAMLMGGTMAVIMMGFMFAMYPKRGANVAILVGGAIVFGLSLWLVRSQITVSGTSYMRAMIPHHSIAVMTSERANITDPRVRKLADEIIAAQRREIAEMRYLIAHDDEQVEEIYESPIPMPGTVEDALSRVDIAGLDPAPLQPGEADTIIGGPGSCVFQRSPESGPILAVSTTGSAVMHLNGVLVPLEGPAPGPAGGAWEAEGAAMRVAALGDEADWRSDAELVFQLEEGLTVGYRGFWNCGA
ncbi:DUF305 domain-containing protein [Pseudoroseicyclus tamaricis]|uniref:DUF305 domain-containing protein n=1 Tax=Pseudoroseicyclus tamaricis TaxID=2705421 RepID=A0A6B2JS77_9RHOB|nr:DUF305 domain-containing protein [Pseudoroseicyclus tamaricis]NDV01407.1 DUF305 domain-containing protein [Pseudoroseicyclus tamaricis]